MNQNQQLADLLFPDVSDDLSLLEKKYPPRDLPQGAMVTRFAPSPTGLPHLGNVFTCNVDLRAARKTGGIVYLRIEDTDAKRAVDDGIAKIISMLGEFGLEFDEGPTLDGGEKGNYGPYIQSQRKALYHACAKWLVVQGHAYPCFCSAEELDARREKQTEAQVAAPGYFGEWATCRNLSLDEVKKRLESGQEYVLRLKSPAKEGDKVILKDMVRGEIEFPANIMDIVLLKSDGIPTYHFAHIVDDHFMRTTHVVRGDEWLPSAPVHLQMFELMGWQVPEYIHVAPICKIEGNSKRKLSKRKDPEVGLSYYNELGYPKGAVIEYLTSIANSSFEEWRLANPDAPFESYPFRFENMSVSGAVFDLAKLDDVCKNYFAKLTAEEVYAGYLAWAKIYDADMAARLKADPAYFTAMFAIDRGNEKPRKDLYRWSMVREYYAYFIDEDFEKMTAGGYDLGGLEPKKADMAAALTEYLKIYDPTKDRDEWFAGIKETAAAIGYAPETKLYKKNPELYKGQLSEVAAMVRIALTGRNQTPDLYSITQVLGKDRVTARIQKAIEAVK